MKNLKVTFYLKSAVDLDRYTTLDSILLFQYFKRKRANSKDADMQMQDPIDCCDFIKSKDGVFSGSIWFVDEDTNVALSTNIMYKRTDYDQLAKYAKQEVIYPEGSGEFKRYVLAYDLLIVPKIYFYITGDKKIIEDLLSDVSFIGKKSSIGQGEVINCTVEEIKEEKGFLLEENNPSKPLPLSFGLDNAKLAYFTRRPPRWDKRNMEVCYMPNSSLIETKYIKKDKKFVNKIDKYISPTEFVFNLLKDDPRMKSIDVSKEADTRKYKIVVDSEHICAATGAKSKRGKKGNIKSILGLKGFTDYSYFLKNEDFLSESLLWSLANAAPIKNKIALGNQLFNSKGFDIVAGSKMTKPLGQAIKETTLPFCAILKSTINTQHVLFKAKMSISKEAVSLQVGDNSYIFSLWDALECVNEARELIKKYPITPTHLFKSPYLKINQPKFKKEALSNMELMRDLSNFLKKYDAATRLATYYLSREEG